MANYQIVAPTALGLGAGGVFSQTYSYAKFPIGLEADGIDTSLGGGKFVFCQGSNVDSAGAFVHIQNGSAVLLAAANSALNFPVGVAGNLLTATNRYGWVQIQGRVDYARGTNTANTAGVPRYICAGTPGIVVSNVVAGNRIQGVCVPVNQTVTAAVSASGVYDLNRPFVAGLTASL
jgi:hypothetical protein